jgi:hypothetical protein
MTKTAQLTVAQGATSGAAFGASRWSRTVYPIFIA